MPMRRVAAVCGISDAWAGTARAHRAFAAAAGRRMLQVVDCHAEGEPARVVVGGMPHVPGSTVMEKRRYMMDHLDGLRKLLITEPRGYPCQNANVIVPPCHPDASFGFVIMEQNKIYPAMSGHNAMCVATALLETGMVPMQEPFTEFALEAPCGLVKVKAACSGGKATKIHLMNQPAFVPPGKLGVSVEVPTLGTVTLDIAYGGMFYAIVDAASVGLELKTDRGKDICRLGEMIKVAAREQHPVNHPEFDYPGPDNMVFRGPAPAGSRANSQNAVVMTNGVLDWDRPETWTGMIDRSPCGTGTCAVMAAMHARGELAIGEEFVHESIVRTTFSGMLHEETTVAGIPAVVPSIAGQAWVTQYASVVVDPSDPFPEGYTVGDIWSE
eukprot:gnl/TRDRNA2_/TRDRNA2_174766_c0_seq1.p1 gnl/TRDRNA2_/TRDRNA2_174766_c0~~gnl/TRDRNA2_/TRDRNA2_174766_c0_seq1.p1  ORF type:complete len:384 (-),score=63.53 gnl/TRDRNA2_/TRDRNA2_174766_c0_seq1:83-1234(-)